MTSKHFENKILIFDLELRIIEQTFTYNMLMECLNFHKIFYQGKIPIIAFSDSGISN